jgi:hypothetical protein
MRRWLTLLLGLALGLVVYIVAVPLFERVAPRSWVRAYARFANPFFEPWTGLIWGWADIEANPRVRLRVHGSWRTGTAHVLTEDSPP